VHYKSKRFTIVTTFRLFLQLIGSVISDNWIFSEINSAEDRGWGDILQLAGQYRDLENGSVLLLQDSNGSSVFSG
jgi:hypothetical protein